MVSHSTDSNPVPLSNLLPSPYHIVYAVFLLVTSFALTFAGAFLTLDRTRQFAPTNLGGITSTKSSKAKFRLEGGVGGLLGGFVFGVHCTTLLALLIINRTSAASLGAVTFLLVYFPPSIFLSLLAARFKLIALLFLGLGGGAAFSLFITYACHPSKLARVILLAVFSIICGVVCLLPIAKVQHGMVRASASWLGALGMIVSIALLANIPSYSDPWARLWVSWDASWGNSQEHGLTAAFICLVLVGIAVDFGLHRMLGENPDAKWDSYLANYAANLPNSHDRPGVFNPDIPFWKKLFAGAETKSNEPIVFPPDKALLSKPTMPPGPGKGLSPPPYRQGKLRNPSKKTKSYPFGGTSFQPLNKVESSDSSDSEEENRYIPRPWAKRKDTKESWDGVTLADVSSAHSKGKGKSLDGDVIYSDGESVSPSVGKKDKDRDAPGWTPEFIKRHSSGKPSESPSSPTLAKSKGAPKLSAPAKRGTETPSPPPGAVPMTPSLLKALDRVSKAQSEAYGGIVSRGHTPQATTTPATAPTGPSKPTATPKAMGIGAKIGLGSKADEGVKMPAPAGGYDWTKFWRNVEENVKEDPNSLVPTSPTNAKTGR